MQDFLVFIENNSNLIMLFRNPNIFVKCVSKKQSNQLNSIPKGEVIKRWKKF